MRRQTALCKLDPVEVGWVAGLVEGEGSISTQIRHGHCYPRLVVQMTDEDVVRRLGEVTGVGRVLGPYEQRGNRRPLWIWSLNTRVDVVALAQTLYPLLGARRRAQIDILLDAYEATSSVVQAAA